MTEEQIKESLGTILKTLSNYDDYCDNTTKMGDHMRLGSLIACVRDVKKQVEDLSQQLDT